MTKKKNIFLTTFYVMVNWCVIDPCSLSNDEDEKDKFQEEHYVTCGISRD